MSLNDLCAGPSLGCSLVWMVGEPYQLIFPFVRNVAFPRARSLKWWRLDLCFKRVPACIPKIL